ncbi:hypothetical protein ACEWPL_005415 [Roseovarius sp. S1116L3]|uniref:hypothetical protein n=1 Tax=Roseovarius roseus TaxID=3342636 RepID=UPI0037279C93
MSTTHTNTPEGFDARIKRVQKAHSHLARGYSAKVGRDGLIVFRPKRRRPGIPVRGILLGVVAFFGFKALVLMQLGDIAYQDRVDALAAGGVAEKAGAWIMQIDPVTRVIVAQVAPLI